MVLGAYWLYALLAVPLIEPVAAGPQEGSGGNRRGAVRRINDRLGELQKLVPPEARAQLETPWIIESDDFKLLLQSYDNLEDGRVTIKPCVLIYTPGSSQEASQSKPPIVLYAPAGAVMVFDRPLDLPSGNMVGRPTSGRLLGEITITSPGNSDGPEDDLLIATRDVQLTPDRISTPNPVRFQYGDSYGNGRNLIIKLLQGERRPGSANEPPEVQGIESFELVELEHLHLEPPKKNEPTVTASDKGELSGLDAQRPLEITCQGPFRFDPIRQYAKFENQVDVLQLNPDGPADQLNCELLTLYFSRSRKKLVSLDGGDTGPDPLGMKDSDLQLREVEATGNPVIVRVFSRDAEARGERLSYDTQQKRVVLEGSDRVFLRQGPNKIYARSIQYTSKGKGRLGEIFSQGPGEMTGEMRNRPGLEFHVEWGDRLQLEPFEDQHLATLSGGVRLQYAGVGTLNAERIDFWLFELPAGTEREKLEILPDRMLVQNRVKIDSPEVFGNVNEMKIWFDVEDAASPLHAPGGTGGAGGPGTTGGPAEGSLADTLDRRDPDKPIERRYYVRGNVAQASFLIRNEKASLTKLMLEGDVRLNEIPLVESSDQPMHLEGDRIVVSDAHDTAQTQITVIGQLASFQGRGMSLKGTNINVDAETNRLWIDGWGEMKLPVERGLEGEPLPHPDVLTLTWHQEMNFDGQKARFEEKVLAQTQGRQLQTELLDVHFTERIVFRDLQSKSRPKIDVEQLVCRGGVFMEGRTYERVLPRVPVGGSPLMHRVGLPNGANPPVPLQASWEQFKASELTINRTSGNLLARGPGHITAIRPKSDDLLDARLGQAKRAPRPPASGNELSYLYVQFRKMMTGNIEQREATFHEEVRCVYSEVDSWHTRLNAYDPDALDEKGVLLTADRLTVARAPAPTAAAQSIELEANGNVVAENRTYTARGNRITYSEAKDWLVLEGDGYSLAELTFQEYEGAPHRSFAASRIHFRPKTQKVKIDDGRSLQMSALPRP